jgi:hypothetical protein
LDVYYAAPPTAAGTVVAAILLQLQTFFFTCVWPSVGSLSTVQPRAAWATVNTAVAAKLLPWQFPFYNGFQLNFSAYPAALMAAPPVIATMASTLQYYPGRLFRIARTSSSSTS